MTASTFHKGADVGWAPQVQAHGHYWRNASAAGRDILAAPRAIAGQRSIAHQSDRRDSAPLQDAATAVNVDYRYNMGAWNSSLREFTVIMNGFAVVRSDADGVDSLFSVAWESMAALERQAKNSWAPIVCLCRTS